MTDNDTRAGTELPRFENKTFISIGTEYFQTFYLYFWYGSIVSGPCAAEYINNTGKTVYAFYAVFATTEKHVHGDENAVNENYAVATAATFLYNRHVCFYTGINKSLANGAFCMAAHTGDMPLSCVMFHGSAAVRYIYRRYGREDRTALHPFRLT